MWLTTATEDGHDFYVVCVDAETGKVLHDIKIFHSDSPEPLGNNVNCYAACSPAISARSDLTAPGSTVLDMAVSLFLILVVRFFCLLVGATSGNRTSLRGRSWNTLRFSHT